MKKTLLLIMIVSCIFTQAVYADCVVDYKTDMVTIDGEAIGNVGITVFSPGNWFEDIIPNSFGNDVVIYNMQKKASDDGAYSFSYLAGGESGVYRYLVDEGADDNQEGSFVFVNKDDREVIVSELNNAENLADVCNKYSVELEIDSSLLNKADASTVTKIILNCIKDEPFRASDYRKVTNIVKYAYQVGVIASGKVSNPDEIEGCISYIDERVNAWMKSDRLTNSRKMTIINALKGSYSSFEDFSDAFIEKLVLHIVEQPSGINNLKDVFNDFADEIGVNTSKLTNNIYNSVSGKKFNSLKELKNEIDKLVNASSKSDSGSSSSGGSFAKNDAPSVKIERNEEAANNASSTFIMRFEDIDSVSWAYEAIAALAREKIISGKSEEIFDPMGNVTREEFVKMLVGVLKLNPVSYDGRFTDVKYGDWFCDYVMTANVNNVCNGIGDGLFGTGQYILRQDMCVMIYNAIKDNVGVVEFENEFADSADISDYAKDAVSALARLDLVHGNDNKEFLPNDNATRAETAVLLNSLKNYLEGGND